MANNVKSLRNNEHLSDRLVAWRVDHAQTYRISIRIGYMVMKI